MVTFGNGVYIHHYISPIIQWLNGAATVPVLWQKFQAIGIIMMLKKLHVAGCSNVARPTFQMRQTEQNTAPNLRYILTELHTHCGVEWCSSSVASSTQKDFLQIIIGRLLKNQYLKLAVMRTRKWGFFSNRTSY